MGTKMIFKGSGCFQFPEASATTTAKESLRPTQMWFTTSSHYYIEVVETAVYKCNKLW